MSEILSISDLTVRIGGRTVIRNFSLAVPAGDFLALVGPNGSGKTTILRTVLGFVKPLSGKVTLHELPAAPPASGQTRRPRVGYVPQSLRLDRRLPLLVDDVVAIGLAGWSRARGTEPGGTPRDVLRQSMAAVGIAHLAGRPIGHLSEGELQKVQIARVMCQVPDLLLMDEPTANLDTGTQDTVINLLAQMHQHRGTTVIIVMHNLQHLPAACRRAVLVADGSKEYDGELNQDFRHRARLSLDGVTAAASGLPGPAPGPTV